MPTELKASEIHLPLLISPDATLLPSSHEIHIETWLSASMWHCLSRVTGMRWTDEANAEMQQETRNFQARQKNQMFQAIDSAKTKRHNLHEHWQQRAHKWWESTRNKKWIWMTYSPTGMQLWFFCLRCGRSGVWTRMEFLDVTQTRSYFAETTSDLWRPRIRFESVIGDPLPLAGLSHDSVWMFDRLIEPQLIGFNIRSNASGFPIKTGQGCNYLLLCRLDVAA